MQGETNVLSCNRGKLPAYYSETLLEGRSGGGKRERNEVEEEEEMGMGGGGDNEEDEREAGKEQKMKSFCVRVNFLMLT